MDTYLVTVKDGVGRKVAEGSVAVTDPRVAVHVISAGMTVCAANGRPYPKPASIEVRETGRIPRVVTTVADR